MVKFKALYVLLTDLPHTLSQTVDQKKLEKVDAKLKVKLEKKAQKEQLSLEAAAEKGYFLTFDSCTLHKPPYSW